jgi:hypothetical protein
MPANSSVGHIQVSPESITTRLCQELQDDCERGLLPACERDEVDRVVQHTVQALWEHSTIKTFLPVLALRQAREQLQAREHPAPRVSRHIGAGRPRLSLDELFAEIEDLPGVRLTLSQDDVWEVVLAYRHHDHPDQVVRIVSHASTMTEAISLVVAKVGEAP